MSASRKSDMSRMLLAITVLLAAGAGCSSQPTAKITGTSLKNIGLQSATLMFDVEVSNPYPVDLPLVNTDYSLASGGMAFLSDKADIQGSIPAHASKTISLPATINYASLLKALQGVKMGSVVPYTADVGLSVNAPVLGAMRLPLKKEGQLPIPAVPEVSVSKVTWQQVDIEQTRGVVALNVVNRNQFPVDLAKLNYAMSLAGVQVADGALAKAVSLPANGGAGVMEIPISFSPRKAGLAMLGVLAGEGSGYDMKGAIDAKTPFGPMSLPFAASGKTIFRR